jgi:hypothetical protein
VRGGHAAVGDLRPDLQLRQAGRWGCAGCAFVACVSVCPTLPTAGVVQACVICWLLGPPLRHVHQVCALRCCFIELPWGAWWGRAKRGCWMQTCTWNAEASGRAVLPKKARVKQESALHAQWAAHCMWALHAHCKLFVGVACERSSAPPWLFEGGGGHRCGLATTCAYRGLDARLTLRMLECIVVGPFRLAWSRLGFLSGAM